MISERDGCLALARAFEQRGYSIATNVPIEREGLSFTADGWDEAAQVGFEYLTHEAGDHLDLSEPERVRLGELMEAGELFMLLIDEHAIDSIELLGWAADRFLDEVERRKRGRK